MKNTLILYHEYLNHFEHLSDAELGQLLRVIMHYEIDGVQPEIENRAVMIAFSFIKADLDINREKYEERCKTNSRNGAKGGRKNKSTKSEKEDAEKSERFFEESEKSERFFEKPKQSLNDNDNEHDNDNGNDIIKRKRFIAPTREEVQAYCEERKNNVDPQHFIDYYTSNGWKVGKNPMKDWKSAVRTWERNGFDNGAARAAPKKPEKESRYDFDAIQKKNLEEVKKYASGKSPED